MVPRTLMSSLLFLAGCGGAVVRLIEPTWDPQQETPYRQVLVVALAGAPDQRLELERILARRLQGPGIRAASLAASLGAADPPTPEALVGAAAGLGADAVLAVRVVAARHARRYDPGTTFRAVTLDPRWAAADPGMEDPSGPIRTLYPWVVESVVLDAGWEEETERIIEATLFRVADGAATWHAQTEVVEPVGLDGAERAWTGAVVDALRRVGQLPPGFWGL